VLEAPERSPASLAIVPARARVEPFLAARVPAAVAPRLATSATFWGCSGPFDRGSTAIAPAAAGDPVLVLAMAAWSTIAPAFAPVI
jgi:hypothetical protein